ncbi:hypothetical protein ABT084_24965 [Streptomyces sp. NPDC002138]|uniref:hypothetical protein n=1 Tax=Streptomyces sp. NPDC002138 TaxID=3154410 RepID=UPI003326867C
MPHPPRGPGRLLLPVAAGLSLALLCAACASHPTETRPHTGQAAQRAAAASAPPGSLTLQDLATALGCTAEVTVDADELREGACGSGKDAYRMATFTADAGQTAWLAESQTYGGTYLVGARWVVTAASAEALAPAQNRLGGSIQSGATHMGSHDMPPEPASTPSPATSAASPALPASPAPAPPSHEHAAHP